MFYLHPTVHNKIMPCIGWLTIHSTKRWTLKITTKTASAALKINRHSAAFKSSSSVAAHQWRKNTGERGRNMAEAWQWHNQKRRRSGII